MKRLLPLMLLVLFATAGSALAGDFPAPYVEVKAGGANLQINGVTGLDDAAGQPVAKREKEAWAGVAGAAMGLNFKKFGLPVRAELEYAAHSGISYDAAPAFPGISGDISSTVDSQTLFLNVFYDIDTGTAFTPYVGGGVGEAWNRTSATFTSPPDQGTVHDTTSSFAWNLAAGCAYNITKNWTLSAGYRYVDLGTVEWGGEVPPAPNRIKLKSDDVTAHELTLGLRYQF